MMNEGVPSIGLVPTIAPVSRGAAVRQMLRIGRRHIRLFCLCAGAVLVLGILGLCMLKPRYTATAIVAISQPSQDPLTLNGQSQQSSASDDSLPSTEASMMMSRDVAAAVLAQYPPPAAKPGFSLKSSLCHAGLHMLCPKPVALDPAAKQQAEIDGFLKTLAVTPELHSRIIDVEVSADSGQRAADLANAVVANYQRLALAQQTDNVNRVAAWLDARTATLQARWQTAVQAANAYSLAHGLTNASQTGTPNPLVNTQVANMAASLSAAQARLASAQARADALHDATAHGDTGALLSLSDQPILVAAATNLLSLQNSRNQLAAEFGPDYPKIKALDAEIAQTRAVVGSQTQAALGAIQEQLVSAQAEVQQLSDNLRQLTAQAGAQSSAQVQYQALSQEADSARTIYETFLEHENDVVDRAALLEPPVELVSHASVPSRPTFPNKPKLGIGILIIALAVGTAAVFVRNHLSEGFEEVEELQANVAVPLLASLPKISADGPIASYISQAPFSRSGEAVRGLVTKLALLCADSAKPRAVLVTSAAALEGKSTLSVWLATAARQGGQSVLVIDGDHRRGTLLQSEGAAAKLGFTDILSGRAGIGDVVQTDKLTTLDYIPAGAAMTRPFGAEEMARLQETLTALKRRYNLIVIDSPPLLAMTDALVYGSMVDQTLFICRWQQTSRAAVLASLERLQAYGAKVAGIVVTMADDHSTLAYGGEYGSRELRRIGRLYGAGA